MPVVFETNMMKESQSLYVNSGQLAGVTSFQASYNVNSQLINHIGAKKQIFLPKGPKVGSVSIDSQLISQDYWINQTGLSRLDGWIFKNKAVQTPNFAFHNTYLTNYSHKYSVNEYPEISVNLVSFGAMGQYLDIDYDINPSFALQAIRTTQPTGLLTYYFQGAADLSIAALGDGNRILSYDINISSPKTAAYGLLDFPVAVVQKYPIEISLNVKTELNSFSPFKIDDYPLNEHTENVTLNLRDINDNITNSYSFSDMTLASQSYEANVNNPVVLNLQYKKFMYA